ncbi:unnamed protein product [Didymodactylos carnosus]|uniref:Macro domain-containing protein n=1 Tax=Didymodactylos carnosus TaxID=1234261 RepID=A0A813SU17_9BILA|nr:unnamed protein product [Didymodactylos carnosus]CAF1061347.1 unnamed protein product [Didymodactylos carnosus]CAF3585447.1 unnamed protein product [Didymodactylos carnosus]CAF3826857.1 unnamed protein product [Didymodactylos carnosus]
MSDIHSKQANHNDRKDHDEALKHLNLQSLEQINQINLHKNLLIYYGNIVDVKADAIVNTANEGLLGGGGLDFLVHSLAGEELKQFCSQVPADDQGVRCCTGHCVITSGFKSNYKYIIHTVGPYLDENNKPQPKLLADCYKNSFQAGIQHNCTSIVFPCISTGYYGYPMLEAAIISIETLNQCLQQCQKSNVIVTIAVFNDLEQKIYTKLQGEMLDA